MSIQPGKHVCAYNHHDRNPRIKERERNLGKRGLTGSESTWIAGATALLPDRICCSRSGKLALWAAIAAAAAISDRDFLPVSHLRNEHNVKTISNTVKNNPLNISRKP